MPAGGERTAGTQLLGRKYFHRCATAHCRVAHCARQSNIRPRTAATRLRCCKLIVVERAHGKECNRRRGGCLRDSSHIVPNAIFLGKLRNICSLIVQIDNYATANSELTGPRCAVWSRCRGQLPAGRGKLVVVQLEVRDVPGHHRPCGVVVMSKS